MDQKLYPYVYLDLDETLIHTYVMPTEIEDSSRFVFQIGPWWYATKLRPCAKELIEFIRTFSMVKILTVADLDYTRIVLNHFGIDIDEEDIVSRDDYIEYVQDGWGGYGGCARVTAICKTKVEHINSVLVDNQEPELPNARIKREYLGIDEDRYIVFPEWDGGSEDHKFNKQFEQIKSMIKMLVEEVLDV